MKDKFKNVPADPETKIIYQALASFGDYPVLYQKWIWSGITAESLIFDTSDVSLLTDAELVEEVKKSPIVTGNSEITIKRTESGYVFVNFNFQC